MPVLGVRNLNQLSLNISTEWQTSRLAQPVGGTQVHPPLGWTCDSIGQLPQMFTFWERQQDVASEDGSLLFRTTSKRGGNQQHFAGFQKPAQVLQLCHPIKIHPKSTPFVTQIAKDLRPFLQLSELLRNQCPKLCPWWRRLCHQHSAALSWRLAWKLRLGTLQTNIAGFDRSSAKGLIFPG